MIGPRAAVVELQTARPPVLLDDERVREFIANGFLRLAPDVDMQTHQEVDALLRQACERETWYGNNILARVPQMHAVLDCPVVRGALISLLGEGYCLHPHRAVHTSTPLAEADIDLTAETDAPPMGKGSAAGSGWHQDAQSPLSRARHHVPRYLIGFYFPHAVPVAMGPTRIQAGSHLYAQPVRPSGVVLDEIAAGTFFLLHFDMVHAGFPNRTEHTRYMVKFVFARVGSPTAPSWNHARPMWRRPAACLPNFDLPNTWAHIWRWMLGGTAPQNETRNGLGAVDQFDSLHQPSRLEAIYGGGHTIEALRDALLACAGQGRHERLLAKDGDGRPLPRDDVRGFPRRWNERAVVMEDAAYALAAQGAAAVPTLVELLDHADPWLRINAAFTLGEIGASARDVVPALTQRLDSPHQQEVRQALDALAAIGAGLAPALPRIERLLTHRNPNWQAPQVMRGWSGEDQVRLNAAFALLSGVAAGENEAAVETIAQAALGDKNGYVSAVATETLMRIGTRSAHAAALRFLAQRRWDETLMGRAKPF